VNRKGRRRVQGPPGIRIVGKPTGTFQGKGESERRHAQAAAHNIKPVRGGGEAETRRKRGRAIGERDTKVRGNRTAQAKKNAIGKKVGEG